MQYTSPSIGRLVGSLALCSAILLPLTSFGATAQEVSATVRREVAANPKKGPAILEQNLRALPKGDRVRFATAALAASLEKVEKNSDRVLEYYERAVVAAPSAVLGLMEVAHQAAPARMVEITEIAIVQVTPPGNFKQASAREKGDFKGVKEGDYKGNVFERDYKGDPRDRQDWENVVAAIMARALALAPDQRAGLTALLYSLFPSALAAQLETAYFALLGPGTPVGVANLSGTMNPANIGGSAGAVGGNNGPGAPEVSPSGQGN